MTTRERFYHGFRFVLTVGRDISARGRSFRARLLSLEDNRPGPHDGPLVVHATVAVAASEHEAMLEVERKVKEYLDKLVAREAGATA